MTNGDKLSQLFDWAFKLGIDILITRKRYLPANMGVRDLPVIRLSYQDSHVERVFYTLDERELEHFATEAAYKLCIKPLKFKEQSK